MHYFIKILTFEKDQDSRGRLDIEKYLDQGTLIRFVLIYNLFNIALLVSYLDYLRSQL